MKGGPQQIEVPYPIKGKNENWAFGRQPEGTSPDCLNVVPYDAISQRLRGGQRWGLSKYITDAFNGTEIIQGMKQATALTASSGFAETFTDVLPVCTMTIASPCVLTVLGTSYATALACTFTTTGALPTGLIVGTTYYLRGTGTNIYNLYDTAAHATAGGATGRINTSGTQSGVHTIHASSENVYFTANPNYYHYKSVEPIGDWYFAALTTADSDTVQPIYKSGKLQFSQSETYMSHHVSKTVVPTGDLYVSFKATWTADPGNAYSSFGVVLRGDRATKDGYLIEFMIAGYNPAMCMLALYRLDAGVATWLLDGNYQILMSFRDVSGNYPLPYQTAWSSELHFEVRTNGDDIYIYANGVLVTTFPGEFSQFTDHTEAGFQCLYGQPTAPIQIDDFIVRSDTETAGSIRTNRIVVVSGGSVYDGDKTSGKQLVTNGAGALVATGRIGMQPAFGKMYFCDGVASHYRVYDTTGRSLSSWTATLPGLLPVGDVDPTKACKIITLYRGRIVLAGLEEEPHNWFMSASGNPLDWDYGATSSATMAVAGNDCDAGECPDIIKCLAPFNDDLMVIGGDHTTWYMRGDPADGGRIDNISNQTGISGPEAYALDPNGVMYFFGSGTVWRLVQGGQPDPISRNRLDKTFKDIDLSTYEVKLVWDSIRHGLHVFIVPATAGTTMHYFWDQRTDGFWPQQYPNNYNPFSVMEFDADDPNDKAILIGGYDSYLRALDSSVKKDDDTAISSYVKYTPITLAGPDQNMILNRIIAVLDDSSDAVNLAIYSDETPQKAIASSTIRFAKLLSAGRNVIINRIAGNTFVFKLSNSTSNKTWALETILATLMPRGRVRKGLL